MKRVERLALVPQLWAEGIEIARGEYVAFTLANCEVSDKWALAMVSALRAGASGVAGPIEFEPGAGQVDRALYYLRYSAFVPARVSDDDVTGELPGDNAAYCRQALRRHRDVIAEGFWEVLFHRRLRNDGGWLCTRRAARARFFGGVRLRQAIRHRFAHGRHFGAWRVAERLRDRWQIVLAAPIVPLLLAARAGSRVLGLPGHRWRFLSSTPTFIAVACAWAAGELIGALYGAGLPRLQPVNADSLDGGHDSTARAASVH